MTIHATIPVQRVSDVTRADCLAQAEALLEAAQWLLRDGAAGPDAARLTALSAAPIGTVDAAEMVTEPLDEDELLSMLAERNTSNGGALAQILNVLGAQLAAAQVTR